MESVCSETFLSTSDETEFYSNPKRVKIESNHKNIEEKDQQKSEQGLHPVNRYKTSLNEPMCLAERQKDWVLEKDICDRKRKKYMRECFHIPTWNNEKLQCRVLEDKLPSKKLGPENEDGNTVIDGTPLNVRGQSFATELLNVWNVTKTGKNVHVANQSQLQETNNIEPSNESNCDNELKNISSVTPLSRDLFQLEMLSYKSVSDKKWRQYQLLQVPFLCDSNSMFSHVENEKNNFLNKVSTREDKDCSSNDSETKRDNTEKNNSSYRIPTLKPFKSIQSLEIPDFLMKENTLQFSGISDKLSEKMPSTCLEAIQWKNFKSQPCLMQSEQISWVLKISGIKEQLQSDKNTAEVSPIGCEFKETSNQPVSKQECAALAERAQVSLTYPSSNSTHSEGNQTFSGNRCKDKMLENSDGDENHKSRVPFHISAKILHNEKHVRCTDISKRIERNRSNEDMTVFHIQESIPVISEPLQKNNLNIYNGVYNSSSSICLHEAESKLLTTEIFDFKRFLTKSITFESNCPHIIVQSFPAVKVSFTILRRKEQFKSKFSFQKFLFGSSRSWTESLYKDTSIYQEDGLFCCLHFCEILKEQYDTQELVNSNSSKSHNNMYIFLLGISKHQKMYTLETYFTSFFNNKKASLPTVGEYLLVRRPPICSRKPIHLNLCINNSLRQNIEFHKKCDNCPCIVSPKLLENTNFDLHNECQKTDFPKVLGKEKKCYFLNKETVFCNQKSVLPFGRCFRKHRLLCRGIKGFLSTCAASVSDKKNMKRQRLVAKCLILLEESSEYSLLEKMYYINIREIQHLTGANLRYFNYLPTSSQINFEKLNSKCSNLQILLTTIKQEKKPRKLCNSLLQRERTKALSFVLNENKKHKATGWRNSIKSANDVTCTLKECLSSSDYINPDRNEYVKSRDLQRKSQDFLSKNSLSIFDTHKKIPLNTDSEDLDQIPLLKQDNLVKEKYSEENTVTTLGNVCNWSNKSGVLILSEQSKTAVEKRNSLQLHNSQTNQLEYCQKMDGSTCSPHLENEKECVYYPTTYLNSGNTFPSLVSSYQYVISPLDRNPLVSKDAVINGDGHCRSFLSAEKQKQYEKSHSILQFPAAGSPTLTDRYLQRGQEEAVHLSLHGHTQTTNTFSLEPATLKQNLEYGKEQEEISDEQMHVTNENQYETLMNDLVMPYSEDESKTCIAEDDKLKMNLSAKNNGCLEDVKDECLLSESKIKYEFELKRKFDLVLEELRLFHEISKRNENNLSSVETNSCNSYCELNSSEGIDENVKNVSQKKICISFPICDTIEGQNMTATSQSSLKEKIANGNEEKKVSNKYCISRQSSDSCHSPTAEGYLDSLSRKSYTWDPAFLSCTLLKEQSYYLQKEGGYFLSHEVIKVQPLKTCRGPIRIGLSRKARPKQLHPYLK